MKAKKHDSMVTLNKNISNKCKSLSMRKDQKQTEKHTWSEFSTSSYNLLIPLQHSVRQALKFRWTPESITREQATLNESKLEPTTLN